MATDFIVDEDGNVKPVEKRSIPWWVLLFLVIALYRLVVMFDLVELF